jgi:release factor glutamine methyltransferase
MKNNLTNINQAIRQISEGLSAYSDSARLDAELIVAAALDHSRSWLLANLEQSLSESQLDYIQDLCRRRMQGEPMAYIIGHQEFWGLKFKVNADVLVPRPETEHLIEWILANFQDDHPLQVADLGTGSGAIGLSIAMERPLWWVDVTDFSPAALSTAKYNAEFHQLNNVEFFQGDWCKALPNRSYGILISNPPYIAENDSHLSGLTHEPTGALVSGPDGLNAIREIISQAKDFLTDSGYLVLEHGYDQAQEVTQLLRQHRFTDIQNHFDLAKKPRFVTARWRIPASIVIPNDF